MRLGRDDDPVGQLLPARVVEVPVTVVDREGKAVTGLTAENFELYDEGKRVPIDYFEVLDLTVGGYYYKGDSRLGGRALTLILGALLVAPAILVWTSGPRLRPPPHVG